MYSAGKTGIIVVYPLAPCSAKPRGGAKIKQGGLGAAWDATQEGSSYEDARPVGARLGEQISGGTRRNKLQGPRGRKGFDDSDESPVRPPSRSAAVPVGRSP